MAVWTSLHCLLNTYIYVHSSFVSYCHICMCWPWSLHTAIHHQTLYGPTGIIKVAQIKNWINNAMATRLCDTRCSRTEVGLVVKLFVCFQTEWVCFSISCGIPSLFVNFASGSCTCDARYIHINIKFTTSYNLTFNSSWEQEEMLVKQSITAHQRSTHMEVSFSVIAPEANI